MEIRIDSALPRIPHRKHWQFCVGSPHALMALRTDYTRQLRFIHDELGIRRVRFHGIFCDDMRTCNDESMEYRRPFTITRIKTIRRNLRRFRPQTAGEGRKAFFMTCRFDPVEAVNPASPNDPCFLLSDSSEEAESVSQQIRY